MALTHSFMPYPPFSPRQRVRQAMRLRRPPSFFAALLPVRLETQRQELVEFQVVRCGVGLKFAAESRPTL